MSKGISASGHSAIISIDVNGRSPRDITKKLLYDYKVWVTPVWYVGKVSLRILSSVLYTKEQMYKLIESIAAVLLK